MTSHPVLRWLISACAGVLLLAPSAHAQAPAAGQSSASSAPAPGMARIWFYREMAPYSSLATPYVRLNGVIAGVSQPGGSSYRDVPPGHYHLSVDSYGVDFDQTRALLTALAWLAALAVATALLFRRTIRPASR